jgi:hypothetical protein
MTVQCIYKFNMILRVNSDYFLKSTDQLIFVMETRCFLWGKNYIFKSYLDEFQLQGVKPLVSIWDGEFLDWLNDYQLLKKDPAIWSSLVRYLCWCK